MSSADKLCNSLDPDQGRQKVGSDLDQNSLTLMVFLQESFKKVDLKKKQTTIKHAKFPSRQRVKCLYKHIIITFIEHKSSTQYSQI